MKNSRNKGLCNVKFGECISSEKDSEDTFFRFCEDTSFSSLDE